jgi:two-component system alkaline phosphatase synthesis response regulator PhoP
MRVNRRVLIVDDEPDVLELVEFKLTGQGMDVIRAATGLEAFRKARCESPEVIVLDLLLPDLDGLSVCEILRAQPSTRDVPVVVFSVLDRPITGTRGARTRVFHWVKKGSDLAILCDRVRAALDEHVERVKCRTTPEERPARDSAG